MIRVTIEMVPMGLGEARHMATIEIHNDLEDSLDTDGRLGSYRARLSRISQYGRAADDVGWYDREVRVTGINRRRSGAVYRIVHGVLSEFLK